MGRQTITSEQWLAAVASVDDNPAVRAMARETLDELRSIRQQLAQADQFGHGEFTVTRDAHARALRALERVRARDEAALALVDDLLRPWASSRPVHPGRPAREASFMDVETVQGWWAARAALARAHEAGGQD